MNTRLGEVEHSLTAQLAVVEDEARAAVEAGLQQQLATVQAALEAGNRVSLGYYHHHPHYIDDRPQYIFLCVVKAGSGLAGLEEEVAGARKRQAEDREELLTLSVEIFTLISESNISIPGLLRTCAECGVLELACPGLTSQPSLPGLYRLAGSHCDRPAYRQDGGQHWLYYNLAGAG